VEKQMKDWIEKELIFEKSLHLGKIMCEDLMKE
jgi:hypothetical protein